MTSLYNFAAIISLEISEATHFKFRVLIDTYMSTGARGILPPNGLCDVSRDLLKFRETSDIISLRVQDRDIVAMEH